MTPVSDSGRSKRSAQSRTVKTKSQPQRPWRTGVGLPNVENGTPLQLLISSCMNEIGNREQGYPLSFRQVAERTGKHKVSHSTVSLVYNGQSRSLSDRTIAGLALALHIDEKLIRQAIEQSQDQEWSLPAKFQQLDADGWKQLMEFGDFVLGQQKKNKRRT